MDEKKESFKHVSVDYPTDYSTHTNFVLFDYDKFDKWLGRLEDAHEREVREHTLEYDIDGLSDRELAEHGLARLPVGSAAEDNERFRREAGPFCDRLREAVAERADVTLFGVDYIAMPVDADGAPIHVGDTLDGYGKTIEVVKLRYGRGGWVLISRDGSGYADTFAFAHHHAPTVEDVLREFSDELWNRYCIGGTASDSGVRELEAKYAARLRLAGDE